MDDIVLGQPNPNFMASVPELVVLRLLKNREMYGYEIVQAVREQSGQVINAGEGVIYPELHALERDGAVKSRRKTVNGRSRVELRDDTERPAALRAPGQQLVHAHCSYSVCAKGKASCRARLRRSAKGCCVRA